MPENLQYQVKRGDNLISIARRFGLNSLDELLELNPEITNPNQIRVNQILNLPGSVEARSSLPAAVATAEAPTWNDKTAWANLPASVRQQVMAYTQAVNDGKMNFNSVPRKYQQHVFNQGIRNATTEAAPYVVKWGLLAPWSIMDTAVRGGLNEGRKLVKRVTTGDKSEDDYGIQDYFGNFSWLGKDYQEEHPVADAAINMLTTPAVMVGGERLAAGAMDGTLGQSLRAFGRNARSGAEGTARAMGVGNESPLPAPREGAPVSRGGVKFQSGSKGSGKTGTSTRFSRGGYQPNSSGKGTYSNQASYNPQGRLVARSQAAPAPVEANPFVGTGYTHGFMVPLPEPGRTPYVIVNPEETHVEETIPTNRWIYTTNYEGPRVPYRRGMEEATYTTAEAPRGNAVEEQPILRESVKTGTGRVVRKAEEKAGAATGTTPTRYFSGYGFTYGPSGGPLIFK